MKTNSKYDVADDYSLFSCLPDEIVLQILSKLVDFKTLCLCELVSKRFWRIFHQVDTICFTSFTHPFAGHPSKEVTPYSTPASPGTYWSAINRLKDFGRVKSLHIQVPSSFDNNHLLFKWKLKFGNTVDTYIFLSPNSVFPNKELYVNANGQGEEEEDMELYFKKLDIAVECFKDVDLKFLLLMAPITKLPLLQDVSIADPGKKVRVSLNGEKVAEMRNLYVNANGQEEDTRPRISTCYVPLLKLPVSGYVMKEVTLFLLGRNDLLDDDIDSFMNIDLNDFEDQEEVAYSEAVKEIVKNHRSQIARASKGYVLLLDLPVSGVVMKGATLFICESNDLPEWNDGSMAIDDLNVDVQDKEEATYY